MTNHTNRLYALAVSVLVLFLARSAIAARPWQAAAKPAQDPRLTALAAREHRLKRDAVLVRRVVGGRWAEYRVQLAHREKQIARAKRKQAAQAPAATASAAAPPVRIVTLPPLTITRTS